MNKAEKMLFIRLTKKTLELLVSTKQADLVTPKQMEVMNRVLEYLNPKNSNLPEARSKVIKSG